MERKLIVALAILLLWSALVYLTKPVEVKGVVDGDTLLIKEGKLRFLYIDAPELGKQKDWVLSLTNGREGCLRAVGREAKRYVERNAEGARASLFRDEYGRLLGYAVNSTGGILGLDMVKKGLAVCYYRTPWLSFRAIDVNAYLCLLYENEAKESASGLWAC